MLSSRIGDEISTRASGVPQGTVLGPLLFLIYINDISEQLQSPVRLFADDSVVYREIQSIEDTHTLQQDLFRLQEWADKWQMSFNVAKCKVLRITRKTKHKITIKYLMLTPNKPKSDIKVPRKTYKAAADILRTNRPTGSYESLCEISSDKYLGVILDNRLSFNSHIDEIVSKATKLLNLCRRNLHMCSPELKEIAYKSLVRPHLEYASPAWSPHTQRNINKVEAVQTRAARFVLGNYTYGPESSISNDIKLKLGWKPLYARRALYDLSLFYKIRNGLIAIPFPVEVQPSYMNNIKYQHMQVLHAENYRNSFFPRTVRLWNALPVSCRSAPSEAIFNSQCQSWLAPRTWGRVNGIFRPL